jgi:pyruvate dehydrogenase E1 component alpha subunit
MADQSFLDSVQADADKMAAELREFCFTMPEPPVRQMFDHVYAEPSPAVDSQREELLSYLAAFGGGH